MSDKTDSPILSKLDISLTERQAEAIAAECRKYLPNKVCIIAEPVLRTGALKVRIITEECGDQIVALLKPNKTI